MSSTECIVLDFDGTFTRVDDEAVPFVSGFRDGLRARVGDAADTRWAALASRVEADPDHYGWEYEGTIVAPSHADPYIMTTTIAQLLLSELGLSVGARTDMLQALYKENYPKSRNVFRNDARRVVEACVASGVPVFVVTNSQTEHVMAKLRELAPDGLDRISVRGDARDQEDRHLRHGHPHLQVGRVGAEDHPRPHARRPRVRRRDRRDRQEVRGFSIGDRVSGEGHITCGFCRNCRAGRATSAATPWASA
jgi:phosphoglycolate phosphatase-like HAD superfamily hydrolase